MESLPAGDVRFSRQLPLLGEDGMLSLASSTIIIHNLNGLGAEIGIFQWNTFVLILLQQRI